MLEDKKLRLSITGGSGVGILKFEECQMKTYWFLQGWRLRFMPYHLAMGIVVHDANFQNWDNPNRQRPTDYFKENFNDQIKNNETGELQPVSMVDMDYDQHKKNILHGSLITAQAERILPRNDIKAVETKLESSIINPENGIVDPEFEDSLLLCGKRDILETNSISDLKTSSVELKKDDLDYGAYYLQTETYRYLTAVKSETFHNVKIYNVTKHKIPRASVIETKRTDADFFIFYKFLKNACRKLMNCIKTNTWEKNLTQCKTLYGTCQYYALCHGHKFASPEKEIDKKLYKKEDKK